MEVLSVHPENSKQLKAVKAVLKALNVSYTAKKEDAYDPEFVDKIQRSRRQAREGKVTIIKPANIWK